jgi:hypothetical protein
MKSLALSTLLVAISCSTAGTTSPSASPSTAPTASASASGNVSALPGSTFSMPAERDMVSFYADRGSLIAYQTKDAPSPYDSKIVRAEAPNGPWKLVYESDAMFMVDRVSTGRIGFIEYRETYQSGGAYSDAFVVVDLASGQKTEIDRFALSAATYHGGGGGPRRPAGAMTLGPDHVAWTRLVEGPGGSITGELRIASLADLKASQVVTTSSEWVRPLDLVSQRLVYVLGGKTEDTLHVREVQSGIDKVVASGAVGNQQRGEMPGFDYAEVSGDWAVWLDGLKGTSPSGHALNLVTGEERVLKVSGSSCSGVSGGSRYFVWACGRSDDPRGSLIVDAKTLDTVRPIPADTGVGLIASDDGLLWFNVPGSGRTVTLFRPN